MQFLNKTYMRMLSLLRKIDWAGPLLVRVTVGIVFVTTGWGKLHSLGQVTQYFESLHIPLPGANATMVATIEFVGGLLLVAGFATRLVSALLIGTMAVALYTAILPDLHGVRDLAASIEFTYLAIFAWLVVAGAGRASVDSLIFGRLQKNLAISVTAT
jgi:putative oxidoreductase